MKQVTLISFFGQKPKNLENLVEKDFLDLKKLELTDNEDQEDS